METTEDYTRKLFSTMPSNISTTTAKKKALELVKWKEEQLCNSYFLQRIRATKSDAEARRLIRETDEKGNILTYWGGLEEPKQETLEEFIQRQLSLGKYQDQESAIKYSIELGAKWQQERMYSEEIIDILDNVRYWETCPNSYKVIIERFIEQNKKK